MQKFAQLEIEMKQQELDDALKRKQAKEEEFQQKL